MYTKLKQIDGKPNFFNTNQWSVGVYVIINNDPKTQYCIHNITEREFHIKLRRDCLKSGGTILDGTKIENYKGRYKINKFIK